MVKSRAARSSSNAMGQTSSQLHNPSVEEPTSDRKMGSAKAKARKRERKSIEIDQDSGPEAESARALLLMRGQDQDDQEEPANGDDMAASQQLILESSPIQSPNLSNRDIEIEERAQTPQSITKAGKRKKKKKKQKPHGAEVFEFPNSDESNLEDSFSRSQLLYTPPDQIDHSSPELSRSSIPHSQHALDDVSTDEETAQFDEAFGNGTVDAEVSGSGHAIHSFSQQLRDAPDQPGAMHPTYQLPTHVYTSPKAPRKLKKKKRVTTLAQDENLDTNGSGQQPIEFNFESLNNSFVFDQDLANPFRDHQDHELPIDPELNSIGTLPPAVDMGGRVAGTSDPGRKRKRKSKHNSLSQPNKRKKIEGALPANEEDIQYEDNHSLQDNRENAQDLVSPGVEDSHRQISPELGTSFIVDAARASLQGIDSGSKSTKTPRKNKKKDSANAAAGQKESSHIESDRSLKDIANKGGAFTTSEMAKLDDFRDNYCDANGMNYRHFNSLIQSPIRGNSQILDLFNEIHEVLPYRPRLSVQKFVRRRFHNFTARGTWTAEEDEMLKQAVAEKGKSWKAVGEMIERMPGDCRDRWRNYLNNSEHRNREQWTEAEIQNLCMAILECMQLMKEERRRAWEEEYGMKHSSFQEDSDQEVEDMKVINWQAVSDRMGERGGGRSRLQCNFKWSQLKKKDQHKMMLTIRQSQAAEVQEKGPTKNPWRAKRAAKKVANMRTGDRHVFLQSILACNVTDEGNIPWRSIGDNEFRALWNVTEKKAAWEMMKKTVPESQTMDAKEMANALLTDLKNEGVDDLEERWDPEVHGDVSMTQSAKPRKAKRGQAEEDGVESDRSRTADRDEEARKVVKSNDFVAESEDNERAGTANELPNGNRYTVLPRSAKANKITDTNGAASSTADEDEQENHNAADDASDQDSLFNGEVGDNAADDEAEKDPDYNGLGDDTEDQSDGSEGVGRKLASQVRSIPSMMSAT